MKSINSVLEDNSISEIEKLNKLNELLDTNLEKSIDNVYIDFILSINTEDTELKCNVLRKTLFATRNTEENIKYFVEYFKKTYNDLKNHKILAKLLILIFDIKKYESQIKNIVNQLGIKAINKVILSDEYVETNQEFELFFISYLKYLSTDHQAMFLNEVFELSENYHKAELISLTLKHVKESSLILDKSIFRTNEFWIYLTNSLINSNELEVTKIFISILQRCIYILKNTNLELKFLSMDGDENAWNAFFAFMHLLTSGRSGLVKPSLQLLSYVSPMHYFWQHVVYKMLVKHTPIRLKCTVLANILKQTIKDEHLSTFFKFIFSVINEQKCDDDEECIVLKALSNFCENTKVENIAIILDELLSISWNGEFIVWNILGNVLVESKKNLISFEYFPRILRHLEAYSFVHFPHKEMEQISAFFYNPDNGEYYKLLKDSSIPFPNKCDLPVPEELFSIAIPKLMDLSIKTSDDFGEIATYLGFLKDITTTDLIKKYPVSIHVRMVIYIQLFNMNGYFIAQTELDQEKTVNDFHEYLVGYLNEKTYLPFRELMLSFLEIMDRFMNFVYPKKACSEFLNIILNPELYTKYQICCATEVLRLTYYRFDELSDPRSSMYKEIAHKWKHLVLEIEDPDICEQGLYFIFEKGQLNEEEYIKTAKQLLNKHFCDKVTKEFFSKYLRADLMNFAFKRLKNIMEINPQEYEDYSKLFCEAISNIYVTSDQFNLNNEEVKFCFSSAKNLEYSIRELDFKLLDLIIVKNAATAIDFIVEIYINKLSRSETKIYCLHLLIRIVSRNSYPEMRPPSNELFEEDVKRIMDIFKEKYSKNLKDELIKLRIVQALFFLIPFVMRDFMAKFKYKIKKVFKTNIFKKYRNKLKRIAMGIIVKESDNKNNSAARQVCQFMYVLLFQHDGTFKEIERIIEKVKDRPDLATSLMPILYHVMPFCEFSRNEIEELIESLILLTQTSNGKLKIFAELLLQRLYILYKNNKFKEFIQKYTSKLEQIDLIIETNRDEIANILKSDYLFLKVLDPVRDHASETVLYILPKLNQFDPVEWEDAMKYGLLWYSEIQEFTVKKDNNETLKKSVEEFVEPQDPQQSEYDNYCAEDILKMFGMSFEMSNP